MQIEIAGTFADPKSKNYDAQEAGKWYELAARNGDSRAMLSLAFLYGESKLGRPEQTKAFFWFKEAAEKGDQLLAWANLAICYWNGLGTTKDPEKAAAICKAHCETDIVCYLGTIGRCPKSILNADQEAALNMTWATDENDPHAQMIMGQRCLQGPENEATYTDAASWFGRAAERGEIKAYCQLGLLYDFHGGSFKPGSAPDKAKEYYLEGAKAGDPNAMANLARLIQDYMMINQPADNSVFDWKLSDNDEHDIRLHPHESSPNDEKAASIYERCLQLAPHHVDANNNLAEIYRRRITEMIIWEDDPAAI